MPPRALVPVLLAAASGAVAATEGRLAAERAQRLEPVPRPLASPPTTTTAASLRTRSSARTKDWSCEDPQRQWERSKDDGADRAEVVAFARAMAVENWYDGNRLWLNETRSVCDWQGICCEVGPDGRSRVTELHVERNGLNGSFPPTFAKALSRLKVLDVHLNNVTNFPPGVEALVHLEEAKFGRNPICGTIPQGFAALTNLTHFNCNFCCKSRVCRPSLLFFSLRHTFRRARRLEWRVSGHPRQQAKARGAVLGWQRLHRAHPSLGLKLEAPDQDQLQPQQHVGAHSARPCQPAVARLPHRLGHGFRTVRHQRWEPRAGVAPPVGRQRLRLPNPARGSEERLQRAREGLHTVAAELLRLSVRGRSGLGRGAARPACRAYAPPGQRGERGNGEWNQNGTTAVTSAPDSA